VAQPPSTSSNGNNKVHLSIHLIIVQLITMQNAGTLYIVATPIGNLEDMSPRARKIIGEADHIAAEDTRHTGRLLSHFGIKKPQISLHDHNEAQVAGSLIERLIDGRSIALVCDAGTPLISDPGYRLVRAAHQQGIPVSPVPGPCAAIAAVSAAGLPTDRFCFEGFLPAKGKARQERLRELAVEPRTLIFYESVHRIGDTIRDLVHAFGDDRPAFIGRELSKLHEQCVAAPLLKLQAMLSDARIPEKGEFVLVIGGSDVGPTDSAEISVDALLETLAETMSSKQVVATAVTLTGRPRNELYKRMLAIGTRQS
jgi:16S rRNA (cytidine1402-2'-O)-methyltransferase